MDTSKNDFATRKSQMFQEWFEEIVESSQLYDKGVDSVIDTAGEIVEKVVKNIYNHGWDQTDVVLAEYTKGNESLGITIKVPGMWDIYIDPDGTVYQEKAIDELDVPQYGPSDASENALSDYFPICFEDEQVQLVNSGRKNWSILVLEDAYAIIWTKFMPDVDIEAAIKGKSPQEQMKAIKNL